jgi:hypothetical protein
MADEHLATYLNDHLAGSTAAVELMEGIESSHRGTEIAGQIARIRSDVEADRRELQGLIERLNVSESRPRKAAAWLAGKFTDLKLVLDDSARGPLRLLESLEVLSLGIEGKRLLWRALATAAEFSPKLRGLDYERLAERAEDQRRRVEPMRLEAARAALGTAP